jgi:hypothetical protein
LPAIADQARAKPCLSGGSTKDYATARRAEAFKAVCAEAALPVGAEQIIECGCAPRSATAAMESLHRRLGGLPAALFINSLTAVEGGMSHFVGLPAEAFAESAIGSFDYDVDGGALRQICIEHGQAEQCRHALHRRVETAPMRGPKVIRYDEIEILSEGLFGGEVERGRRRSVQSRDPSRPIREYDRIRHRIENLFG